MKAYEFPAKVTQEGRLELPESLLKHLLGNQQARVIILVNEPTDTEEEAAWRHLAAEQFFADYSDADAI
ncbi:hypothetical protein [Iningainema tapete]|uniref:Uncharacterized protein n=1 Tax=Iningainema tapete BLCC-T55 TaxID=2748662 RepID=A0A8J6XI81_9CYAN|nr:hypothetical protein [Iningainema tapete]MBD2772796.1 hypothetical protein [Iningainema tapete BLCC-T55]